MALRLNTILPCLVGLAITLPAVCQSTPDSTPQVDQATLNKLLDRLAEDEARIKELEGKLGNQTPQPVAAAPAAPTATAPEAAPAVAPAAAPAPDPTPVPMDMGTGSGVSGSDSGSGGGMMSMLNGPKLTVHGYLDFDFGVGSDTNPLIFPMGVPPHSGFQVGEFDLMTDSKLSNKLSFMSEIVLGTDPTNLFGLDIERYILQYRATKYFEIEAGRYHTAMGWYNTAFHHGTWFQTATGRPFMYFFEDSGGMLPVHSVGVSATGLVPGTDKLGLHWVAEVGNGRASDKNAPEPVQNFYSDRNHKDVNFSMYIAPEGWHNVQIGGSYYMDRLAPPGLRPVDQNISSFYAVYVSSDWEFLNEGVLLSNHLEGGNTFNTPLAYTQISHKFNKWRPYFRYQYVNSPANDPVNVYTGRYMGPSLGIRYDFADYACFKVQYNRLDQRNVTPENGLDAQVAFTF